MLVLSFQQELHTMLAGDIRGATNSLIAIFECSPHLSFHFCYTRGAPILIDVVGRFPLVLGSDRVRQHTCMYMYKLVVALRPCPGKK